MFEYKKYYEYIQILEITKTLIHLILMALGFFIGVFWNIKGILIGISTGFILASLYSFKLNIQIQKMKWEIDINNMMKDITKFATKQNNTNIM